MTGDTLQSISGALAALCGLAILVVIVLRFVFNIGPSALFPKPSGLAGNDPFPRVSTYFVGLTASVAFTELLSTVTPPIVDGAILGAAFGVIALIIRGTGDSILSRFIRAALTLPIGIAAFGPAIGAFFYPSCADEGPAWVRPVVLVVVGLAVGAGLVMGFIRSFVGNPLRPIAAGAEGTLTFFSAFKIAAFLLTPFGLSVLGLGMAGWVVSLVGLVVLIFACFLKPTWVLRAGGVAILLSNFAVYAVLTSACGAPDPGQFFVVLGYSVVFFLVAGLAGRFVPDRIDRAA